MHIDRLTTIAEWLEGGGQHRSVKFNMAMGLKYEVEGSIENLTADTVLACGTACCLAGAAVQFFNNPKALIEAALEEDDGVTFAQNDGELPWDEVFNEAAELLGIDRELANELFEPGYRGNLWMYSDPAWAARVVRHLITTGEVDWEGQCDALAAD